MSQRKIKEIKTIVLIKNAALSKEDTIKRNLDNILVIEDNTGPKFIYNLNKGIETSFEENRLVVLNETSEIITLYEKDKGYNNGIKLNNMKSISNYKNVMMENLFNNTSLQVYGLIEFTDIKDNVFYLGYSDNNIYYSDKHKLIKTSKTKEFKMYKANELVNFEFKQLIPNKLERLNKMLTDLLFEEED